MESGCEGVPAHLALLFMRVDEAIGGTFGGELEIGSPDKSQGDALASAHQP